MIKHFTVPFERSLYHRTIKVHSNLSLPNMWEKNQPLTTEVSDQILDIFRIGHDKNQQTILYIAQS